MNNFDIIFSHALILIPQPTQTLSTSSLAGAKLNCSWAECPTIGHMPEFHFFPLVAGFQQVCIIL